MRVRPRKSPRLCATASLRKLSGSGTRAVTGSDRFHKAVAGAMTLELERLDGTIFRKPAENVPALEIERLDGTDQRRRLGEIVTKQ